MRVLHHQDERVTCKSLTLLGWIACIVTSVFKSSAKIAVVISMFEALLPAAVCLGLMQEVYMRDFQILWQTPAFDAEEAHVGKSKNTAKTISLTWQKAEVTIQATVFCIRCDVFTR